jgi:hypothetical protein
MSRSTRWGVAALLSLAPLAGLTYAYPDWPADTGLDVWNVPSLRAEIELRQQQHNELDAEFRQTEQRMAHKAEIALDLIDGHITLREAIAAFRAANANNRFFPTVMRLRYPHASDDELQARNALDTAAGLLDLHPRRDEILARLNTELDVIAVSDASKMPPNSDAPSTRP